MWVLYAVVSILHAFLSAVYAHSYVYITSFALIVSYSIKSQSFELVHSFTQTGLRLLINTVQLTLKVSLISLYERVLISLGVQYIADTWAKASPFFAAYATNRVLHMGAVTTSRVESGHAALKRTLQVSTGDLNKVVNDVNLIIIKQTRAHYLAMDEEKGRPQTRHRKTLFAPLRSKIINFALQKVYEQYDAFQKYTGKTSPCTGDRL